MAEREWTDELKKEVVEAYENSEPTTENTMEIVKDLAEQFEKTPNGIRMILTKAGVYVKKSPTSSSTASTEGKSTRINKTEAINGLKKKIKTLDQTVDDDILDRLTGKAAAYITGILEAVK